MFEDGHDVSHKNTQLVSALYVRVLGRHILMVPEWTLLSTRQEQTQIRKCDLLQLQDLLHTSSQYSVSKYFDVITPGGKKGSHTNPKIKTMQK